MLSFKQVPGTKVVVGAGKPVETRRLLVCCPLLALLFGDLRADERQKVQPQKMQLELLRTLLKTCGSSEAQRLVGALLEGFGSAGELLAAAVVAVEVEVNKSVILYIFCFVPSFPTRPCSTNRTWC